MSLLNLTITSTAREHFSNLLERENVDRGMNLRISVLDPGTANADVSIMFCPKGEQQESDLSLSYPEFTLYVEQNSQQALHEAVIDYKTNDLGGHLSIKGPHIKGRAPSKDDPLSQRVQYIIDTEINPNLAAHRGFVTLEGIDDNKVVVLRFGGGCHGCSMVDVTLKHGIEKNLMQQCPDITAVRDVTNHCQGENPYYAEKI